MSDRHLPTDGQLTPKGYIRLPNGGHMLPDDVYNARWMDRLWARTIITETGCYEWQGPVTSKGYINLMHRRWRNSGHRIVYVMNNGPLRTEQFVCHSCDNRRCWNLAHLWIGTNGENQRDAAIKGRHQESKRTHCLRGHEYNEQNTRWIKTNKPGGWARNCKICQDMRMKTPHYKAQALERQRRKRREKRLALMGVA